MADHLSEKTSPLARTGWTAKSSATALKSLNAASYQATNCSRPAKSRARRFTGFHVQRLRVNWPKKKINGDMSAPSPEKPRSKRL
jgi:hypothetical protein